MHMISQPPPSPSLHNNVSFSPSLHEHLRPRYIRYIFLKAKRNVHHLLILDTSSIFRFVDLVGSCFQGVEPGIKLP
ncbi:unnamed protein product [Lactuca virosa]|uniref:Uncharacterized protein n=1 Tax=Lactuca virosa TaxID=75947 RepID=A0AAU9PM45_9ASTR|nr:unnamed protein product [Lactuca virosa]